MATYTAGQRIRVADQSSEYRRCKGSVVRVIDTDLYGVRIEGHGCGSEVTLRGDQLKLDTTAAAVSYSQCAG